MSFPGIHQEKGQGSASGKNRDRLADLGKLNLR